MEKQGLNLKNKESGRIYPNTGTFEQDGKVFYKTGQYSGISEDFIEFTDEEVWIEISFNCRLGYKEALDCADYIRELGGDGGTTVGGSYYYGDKVMIDKLLAYMGEKGYDLASMSFDSVSVATQKRVDELKAQGVI